MISRDRGVILTCLVVLAAGLVATNSFGLPFPPQPPAIKKSTLQTAVAAPKAIEVRSGINPGDTVILSDVTALQDSPFFNVR